MPKPTQLIPDEIILRDFDILSGSIRLIPRQVSMIMGISIRTLKENRNTGRPPPYIKQGRRILYSVEDVRNYLKSQRVFKSSVEAYEARQKEYELKLLGIRSK